jgi:two-component system NtrC family sensor kinase
MKNPVLATRTWVLLITAAVLFAAGALNFAQRLTHDLPPTDGVQWEETNKGIIARAVAPGSVGERAGILPGDHLIAIAFDDLRYEAIDSASNISIYLEQAGVGGNLHYLIERPSFPPETRFYYADLYGLDQIERWTARDLIIQAVGLVYLFVGLFVLFKQGGRAPFVSHFVSLCLTAFVFHFYKPIGTYEDLDLAIAFLDTSALILFAPLFLHFCAIYPVRRHLIARRRWLAGLLYVPAFALIGFAALIHFVPASRFRVPEDWVGGLYWVSFALFWLALVAGAAILVRRFLRSENAIVRQQLKWIVWGSALAILPFTLFYAMAYLLEGVVAENWLTDLALIPLALIPLTFGNSVVRYRLMDVDIVVRRAAVYALTTLAIALMIGAVVYTAGLYAIGSEDLQPGMVTLRFVVAVMAMAVIVMTAAPIKNYLQEKTDRLFYGERYDLRNSLLDFGRTLSATTALDPLLDALINRLQQVLGVERIAIFIEDAHEPAGYRLARAVGLSGEISLPADFREALRVRSAKTGIVRADDLEIVPETEGAIRRPLHYYVPCTVRDAMVAVIGLGRSAHGALLSSEDLEILRTVSGYVAVAIENSLLYQEQKKRAAELEQLKEFNESIVESVNIGLLAVDLEGRITRCNSALEEMLQVDRERIIGRRVEELFDENFAETLDELLGSTGWNLIELRHKYKLRVATRDGRALVLNIALAPLQRADVYGNTGTLVVLEDVTARTQLEEQLQQAEKLSSIGLLAAGVAHEINTPLTGISSYTQMLLGMIPPTDPKHGLLEKIHRQAERAAGIVNNLLNFSRTGSATEFGPVDIHRVLDDTLQLLEPQLRKGQIEIERRYQDGLPPVWGNAGKLQQVFTNLLLNARDAIIGGGRITLTTSEEDGVVSIEVADTGIGIAPEDLPRIYDPFFTTKGVGVGTGLGLAVTYGIVQEHAGRISVESAVGRGTTFHIILPKAETRMAEKRTRLQAVGD